MNEKLKDTTIDLLLDGVKTKIEDVKENYKWQELFVSTGSFCVNNPDTLTMFEQYGNPGLCMYIRKNRSDSPSMPERYGM